MKKIVLELDKPKVPRIQINLVSDNGQEVIAYQTKSGYWAVLMGNGCYYGFCYMSNIFAGNITNFKYREVCRTDSIRKAIEFGKEVIVFDRYEELCGVIANGTR